MSARRAARRRAGEQRGAAPSPPGMSACSVAKCCSASVSVGAMSAACMPCSTARSIACSATTVLPEPDLPHEQPLHRRARARGRRRPRPSRARWSPVGANGSCSASHVAVSDGGVGAAARRASVRAALVAQAQLDDLVEQQLVERQPPAARPRGRRSARRRRAPGRSGSRSADAQPRRAAARRRRRSRARCSRTSAAICVEVMPFVAGYVATSSTVAGDRLGRARGR